MDLSQWEWTCACCGRRPRLRVRGEHADHPLRGDQTGGLSAERLAALLSEILPCDGRA